MFLPNKTESKVTSEDCAVTDGAGTVCRRRAAPNVATCQPGWHLYESSCYKFNEEKLSKDDAALHCESNNATLAIPSNSDELRFIISTGAGKSTWFGAEASEGTWATSSNGSDALAPEIASLAAANGNCIQLGFEDNQIKPVAIPCGDSETLGFSVCKAEVLDSDAQEWCDAEYTFYDGFCNKAFKMETTFAEAFSFCFSQGGKLAYPTNVADFVS